jgi:hypothetical protein
MHLLAKRMHPEYPWDRITEGVDQYWLMSRYEIRYGFPAGHLNEGEFQCMVCGMLIDPYDNGSKSLMPNDMPENMDC